MHGAERKGRRKIKIKPRFWAVVSAAAFCFAIFFSIQLYLGLRPYRQAKAEYDSLSQGMGPDVHSSNDTAEPIVKATPVSAPPRTGPAVINPDFIGWLHVPGGDIYYPMVQGTDNEKYLDTAFSGEENKLGTIFMDARCADGLESGCAILYGHNARDGSMFGSLTLYEDEKYLRKNRDIEITTPEGKILLYHIVAAQLTDVHDVVFTLPTSDESALQEYMQGLGIDNGTRLLALSTCTIGGGRNERLVIFATFVAQR